MTGRFLFQKLPSRISPRSRSLLSASSSASTRDDVAPVTRPASDPRYFNTLPWSCPAAKTSRPTIGMPSVVAHRAKPAFVGSAGRLKAAFSSSSPTKDTVTREAKHRAWYLESLPVYRSPSDAEREAENKAIRDDFIAWKTKLDKDADDFSKFVTRIMLAWTLSSIGFIVESNRRAYINGRSPEMTAMMKIVDMY